MFDAPIVFEPLFMERVWGGRWLQEAFGKPLPPGAVIGESWELVDREEAESVSEDGTSLHTLWTDHRAEVFGARGSASTAPRFPILIKLLDAEQALSVQVHPPADVAPGLGGEPKTECWVLADAKPDASLLVGLRAGVDRAAFEAALTGGEDVSLMLQRIPVARGDAMRIPSGRVHAIGPGCLIAEIQQNSDTTYRVFDFNRPGLDGRPRELHVPESLASIDFADVEPELVPRGEATIWHTPFFEVDRWRLDGTWSAAAPDGECAIVQVLEGEVETGSGRRFKAGDLALLPAAADPRIRGAEALVLRTLLPQMPRKSA
jgi:mannose-6-phosphate isomerase